MPKSFYLIDGHAQIYRSYYAPFRPLNSPTGEPTKAIHVFCAALFNLIKQHKPDYLAMVLDVSDQTVFRCDVFPEYKAHRDPPPEDLPVQAERIIQIVGAMGIPIMRKEGFEADDLMATLARRLAAEDLRLYLVSKDKDLEQLITDKVVLFDPGKDLVLDRETLIATKGYPPEKAVEVQTLVGDNVDNVPGVPGIGPKTAAKLIEQYGSAQAVLENADRLTPKQSDNVKAFAAQLPVTRQLVTLRDDVEFDFDLPSARFVGIPVDRVKPIFLELGFTRLTDQLETFRSGDETHLPIEPASAVHAEAPAAQANYELVDSEEKLAAFAKKLATVREFAIDTETTAINPVAAELVGISISWAPHSGYYIPVRGVGPVLSPDAVRKALRPIISDPSVKKVGQNIKYDLIVLKRAGFEPAGVSFDTMIASFVLEPLRRSHGIDTLAAELCSHHMIPISDLIGKGRNQTTIDMIDTARVCEYASEDADFTWRIKEILAPQIAASPMRSLYEQTELPLVEVLAEMEHNGVAIDTRVLAKMSNQLGDRIVELQQEIHKAAGHSFNIDSTRQLAVVLFDEQHLPTIKKTKTGRSTDADTLEELAAKTDHPIPKLMLEYRELTKLRNTYIDVLPRMVCGSTGRIHAGFHQTGAVTGRLSSSDPNLQNIPVRTELGRRVRQAFVAADADHVLIVADYSQVELRILAHFSQDEALLAAFRENQDIHAFVAAQVNGVDISEVTSEQRSAAKAVNFGLIYGQTAFGLSRALGIPKSDAQAFIDRYYARYPRIRGFMDRCIAEVKRTGYAETILGRRRPIHELHSRNRQQVALGERLAVNSVIQGSAADLIKRAMIDIHNQIKSKNLDLKMLIQVHDELVFESPRTSAETHAEMIKRKMTTAIPFDVEIAVDIGMADNWLDAK